MSSGGFHACMSSISHASTGEEWGKEYEMITTTALDVSDDRQVQWIWG